MATLRSGKKLDANANSEEVSEKSKEEVPKKDRTTLVVFFGLLIDLLGKIDGDKRKLFTGELFSLHVDIASVSFPDLPLQRTRQQWAVQVTRGEGRLLPCPRWSPSAVQHSPVRRPPRLRLLLPPVPG